MSGLALSARLALAELRHARGATACQVIGLAALILPLLILFGIKNGVIADRSAALLNDPEALRITIGRTDSYPAALIESLRADAGIRFVAPHPVRLAVLADFSDPRPGGSLVTSVTLLATGEGDPYLPSGAPAPAPGEVVISAPLQGALALEPGMQVDALLRPNDATPEGSVLGFTVRAVTPASVWGRHGALLHPDDLFLIQDWSHGLVTGSDLNAARGPTVPRDAYPSLRLYARDADAAQEVMARLAAQGIPTGGTPDGAARLIGLRDALDAGFLTVALVGLAGVTATFSANLWTAVMRNRRPISLLRLAGLARRAALIFPLTQALVIGTSGWVLAVLIYAGLTRLLDLILADLFAVEGRLAQLTTTEIVASGAATLAVSLIASVWAALTITAISPEEGFSDAR